MGNGLIQVVAGAHVKYINNVPHVLLGLKPSGVWEFPGGKVEGVESHQGALEREWIEELGVMVKCEDERFGHARNNNYEVWFYEVDIKQDEYQDGEPMSKEHIEVKYFDLNNTKDINMNGVNRVMLSKLVNKYA